MIYPYGRWVAQAMWSGLRRLCGGLVGGSFRKYYHFVAPSCKLELARLSAELRIQDGARAWQQTNQTRLRSKVFSLEKTLVYIVRLEVASLWWVVGLKYL